MVFIVLLFYKFTCALYNHVFVVYLIIKNVFKARNEEAVLTSGIMNRLLAVADLNLHEHKEQSP